MENSNARFDKESSRRGGIVRALDSSIVSESPWPRGDRSMFVFAMTASRPNGDLAVHLGDRLLD